MKYPNILFFRHDKYNNIDKFFDINKDKLLCNINITNNVNELNKLFDCNYHLLITYGNDMEYIDIVNSIIAPRMRKRWLHFDVTGNVIDDITKFNNMVNFCYISNVTAKHIDVRPIFSIFTTCYKSYEKIYRAYDSVQQQTLKDWEWVILDDSPEDEHFVFLKNLFKNDKRIRLYKRSENNGSIGNVKNEVVSLCRGKYVIELDHDDEILPKCLEDATLVFDRDDSVGFIYMDFTNIYEDGSNFNYGDHYGLGYAANYMSYYKGRWVYVSSTPNINNVTLSHIVGVPNHPRIWRFKSLVEMGNYSEFLPISDDYELLVRTAVNTKIVKIHKMAYVQYMNNGGNNFSYIRNGEINRLCGNHLMPQCFIEYEVDKNMEEKGAYEEHNTMQIWKRENYEPKYCNLIINLDYKKQYCIIGLGALLDNMDRIKELYMDSNNDFLVLDNKMKPLELCKILEMNKFERMKCYAMSDCTEEQLIKYFNLIYKSCSEYEIIN